MARSISVLSASSSAHANHDPVTQVFGGFTRIIRRRKLQMVTLNDYFLP